MLLFDRLLLLDWVLLLDQVLLLDRVLPLESADLILLPLTLTLISFTKRSVPRRFSAARLLENL